MIDRPLAGRIALVTGGSSGIGRGIAIALGDAGAHVVALGRNEERLDATRREIIAAGGAASTYVADLAVRGVGEQAIDTLMREHERLDLLVNAAGVQRRRRALEVTEDDWDTMLDVNLRALFFVCCAAARRMSARRAGSIINITSLTSVFGIPGLSVHGAIKGAVTQLTKALAVEWAPLGLRVNAIGPGRIRTPMTEDVFATPAAQNHFLSLIPMARGGTPEDIGGAAVFLASDAASYITGQTIYVDGGWLAGGGNPAR